ncbi:hypothetical protein [Azospirillum argentinense]
MAGAAWECVVQDPDLIPTPLPRRNGWRPLEVRRIDRPSPLRLLAVLVGLSRMMARLAWMRLAGRWDSRTAARLLRGFLESMGGAWIKVGQILAMRNDVWSAAFCNELSLLQDRACAFPADQARRVIEASIGRRVGDVFSHFEDVPIAAASLCQVHRAQLRRRRAWVAVKVQRPHASAFLAYDVRWIGVGAALLDGLGLAAHLQWREMVRQMRAIIEEELDYRIEAASMQRLQGTLGEQGIYVPDVHEEYCSRQVVVMEFVEGVALSELLRVRGSDPALAERWMFENNIRRSKVAKTMMHSLFHQIFIDNLWHGDLHPGNILLLKNSRLAFIDFGMAGSLDVEYLNNYKMYIGAINSDKFMLAADLMLMLSGVLPPLNVHEVRQKIADALQRWKWRARMKNGTFSEKSLSSSTFEIGQITMAYRFAPNWTLLKLGRAYNAVDLAIGAFYPEIDYTAAIAEFHRAQAPRRMSQVVADGQKSMAESMTMASMHTRRFRENTLMVQPAQSPGSDLLAFTARTMRNLLAAGFAYLAAACLFQADPALIEDALGTGSGWYRLIAGFPRLDGDVWLVFLTVLGLTTLRFHTLARRLGRAPLRLPMPER